MLGWQPKVSFEEGVRFMLENIDQWRSAPVWDEKSMPKPLKVGSDIFQ